VGVELGTGTGWLSAAVLREFPEARMVGLDGASQMLAKAGELLAWVASAGPFRLPRAPVMTP
jgi:trans-aconitate methyltransferase